MNGEVEIHSYYASGMVAVILMINILTIPIIIKTVSGISIDLPHFPKLAWGGMALGLFLSNYFYFNYEGRYLRILDEFKNEDRSRARRGNLVVTVYVIGSFIVLIGSGFLGVYVNKLN